MTTTTKQAKGNPSKLEDGWEDAGQVTSESEHPAWVPHWSTFKDDVVQEKLKTVPEGSSAKPVLIGKLVVARAFGEQRYFVDETTGDKTTRVALPLHGALTSALDNLRLEPAPLVRLEYKGEARRARPGERAAFLYDLRVKPREAILPKAREDALLPVHRENKERREEENNAERKRGGKGKRGSDDAGTGDE